MRTFLIALLVLLVTPAWGQTWTAGTATDVTVAPYSQSFASTFSATGLSNLQDISACSHTDITQTASDVRVAYYVCPASTAVIPGDGCQTLTGVPEGAITTPKDFSRGSKDYFGYRVLDSGASGGSVTMTCRDVAGKTFDGSVWLDTPVGMSRGMSLAQSQAVQRAAYPLPDLSNQVQPSAFSLGGEGLWLWDVGALYITPINDEGVTSISEGAAADDVNDFIDQTDSYNVTPPATFTIATGNIVSELNATAEDMDDAIDLWTCREFSTPFTPCDVDGPNCDSAPKLNAHTSVIWEKDGVFYPDTIRQNDNCADLNGGNSGIRFMPGLRPDMRQDNGDTLQMHLPDAVHPGDKAQGLRIQEFLGLTYEELYEPPRVSAADNANLLNDVGATPDAGGRFEDGCSMLVEAGTGVVSAIGWDARSYPTAATPTTGSYRDQGCLWDNAPDDDVLQFDMDTGTGGIQGFTVTPGERIWIKGKMAYLRNSGGFGTNGTPGVRIANASGGADLCTYTAGRCDGEVVQVMGIGWDVRHTAWIGEVRSATGAEEAFFPYDAGSTTKQHTCTGFYCHFLIRVDVPAGVTSIYPEVVYAAASGTEAGDIRLDEWVAFREIQGGYRLADGRSAVFPPGTWRTVFGGDSTMTAGQGTGAPYSQLSAIPFIAQQVALVPGLDIDSASLGGNPVEGLRGATILDGISKGFGCSSGSCDGSSHSFDTLYGPAGVAPGYATPVPQALNLPQSFPLAWVGFFGTNDTKNNSISDDTEAEFRFSTCGADDALGFLTSGITIDSSGTWNISAAEVATFTGQRGRSMYSATNQFAGYGGKGATSLTNAGWRVPNAAVTAGSPVKALSLQDVLEYSGVMVKILAWTPWNAKSYSGVSVCDFGGGEGCWDTAQRYYKAAASCAQKAKRTDLL